MLQNLDDFQKLVLEAQSHCTNPVRLADLGGEIRKIKPSFTPTDYGAVKLIELMAALNDLGRIEILDNSHPVFRFFSQLPGQRPLRTTVLAPPVFSGLKKTIWDAVISFNPPSGGWKLDLETMMPFSSASDPEGLLVSQPERFVSLPDAGVVYQRNLARQFILEKAIDIEDLDQLLAGEFWHNEFSRLMESMKLAPEWRCYRKDNIVEMVMDWAERHGIPRAKLTLNPHSTSPCRSLFASADVQYGKTASNLPDSNADTIRKALLDLITQMPESQLMNFPVPAWCLPLLLNSRRK